MKVLTNLRRLLPGAADYRDLRRTWRGDLMAGLTVGIVALPLALAFGVSSGVGAEAGLVTAIVAGIVAAVFGGSNVQVSGPTGAMVVVLVPIVAAHGVGAVAIVSLMAGVLVVLAGVLKLGRTVSYLPWPVIEGFTLGIAVIIFLQQVPSAVSSHPASHSDNAFVAAVQSVLAADARTAIWALVAVAAVAAIMVLAPRIHRRLPGSMIAIVVVTLIAVAVTAPLPRIGELPSSLPSPSLPTASWSTLLALIGPAFTVAALAAIESLLSARVAVSLSETGPYDADRELVGQGLASVASSFFGGMPATGAIARTSVNIRSGGRTRLAAIVHGLVLLVVVYLATTVVSQIPLAALSGVLMVTATRMVSAATVRSVLGASRSDALIFVATAIITVSFDLIVAVGIGIAVAAFLALRKVSKLSDVQREPLPGPAQALDERIALLRFDGALFFGAAERILDKVKDIEDVSVVIIRMSQVRMLDATGAKVVAELINGLERRGVTVFIKGVQPQHERLVNRTGVIASLSDPAYSFLDLGEAVGQARQLVRRQAAESEAPLPG
ncbi:SulP family inorganic anion transporter [Nakamurella lactea]|uniref:SulP family inorganic anion transporter n=1 Tax=Nakamurella lactea TaxID=459515 RepID=UPI0004060357|nr:SulP family inorganic anion transporter [Nakamurella lactea]